MGLNATKPRQASISKIAEMLNDLPVSAADFPLIFPITATLRRWTWALVRTCDPPGFHFSDRAVFLPTTLSRQPEAL